MNWQALQHPHPTRPATCCVCNAAGARIRADWDPVGANRNYDTAGFVASCRANRVTTHVAQSDGGRGGGSAIDVSTTRSAGYAIIQRNRTCIEQIFGWSKTVGPIRQAMYRGRERVEQYI